MDLASNFSEKKPLVCDEKNTKAAGLEALKRKRNRIRGRKGGPAGHSQIKGANELYQY